MPRRRSPTKSQAQRISDRQATPKYKETKRDRRFREAETKAIDADGPNDAAIEAILLARRAVEDAEPGTDAGFEAEMALEVAELKKRITVSRRWAARTERDRLAELPESPTKLKALEAGQTLGQASTLGTVQPDAGEQRKIQRLWRRIRGHKEKQAGHKDVKRRFEADAKRGERDLKARQTTHKARREVIAAKIPPQTASDAEFEKARKKREKAQKGLLKALVNEAKIAQKDLKTAEKALAKSKPEKRRMRERLLRGAQKQAEKKLETVKHAEVSVAMRASHLERQRERAKKTAEAKPLRQAISRKERKPGLIPGQESQMELVTQLQARSKTAKAKLSALKKLPSTATPAEHAARATARVVAQREYAEALESDAKAATKAVKIAKTKVDKASTAQLEARMREFQAILPTREGLVSDAERAKERSLSYARALEKAKIAEKKAAEAKPTKAKPPTVAQRKKAAQKELQATSSAAGGELSRLRVPLRSAPAAEQAKYAKAHAAAYAKYIKALESDAKKAEKALKAAEKKLKTGTASEKATAQATMSTIRFTRDFLVKAAPQEQERAAKKGARLEKITEKARAREKKATAKPTTRKPKKRKVKKKTVKKPKPTKAKPKKAKAKKKRVAKPKSTRKPTPATRIQAAAKLRGKEKKAFVKKEAKQRREADKAKHGTKYDLRPLFAYESSVEKELKLVK